MPCCASLLDTCLTPFLTAAHLNAALTPVTPAPNAGPPTYGLAAMDRSSTSGVGDMLSSMRLPGPAFVVNSTGGMGGTIGLMQAVAALASSLSCSPSKPGPTPAMACGNPGFWGMHGPPYEPGPLMGVQLGAYQQGAGEGEGAHLPLFVNALPPAPTPEASVHPAVQALTTGRVQQLGGVVARERISSNWMARMVFGDKAKPNDPCVGAGSGDRDILKTRLNTGQFRVYTYERGQLGKDLCLNGGEIGGPE